MSSKTITVTEDAYEALKAMKAKNESFSNMILRISKRKPLSYFYGALSKESADKLEREITETRKIHSKLHNERIKRMDKEMNK